MESEYVLLVEKEEMWAKMLMEVLKDNDIPCNAVPVHGAALTIKTGMHEILKVYVPSENLEQAQELVDELFSASDDEEDDEEEEE